MSPSVRCYAAVRTLSNLLISWGFCAAAAAGFLLLILSRQSISWRNTWEKGTDDGNGRTFHLMAVVADGAASTTSKVKFVSPPDATFSGLFAFRRHHASLSSQEGRLSTALVKLELLMLGTGSISTVSGGCSRNQW